MNLFDYYNNRIEDIKMKYETKVYSAGITMYRLGYIDRDINQRIKENELKYEEYNKLTRMTYNLYMEVVKNENPVLQFRHKKN